MSRIYHQKPDIKDLSLTALKSWIEGSGAKPFHAGQIFKWIYARDTDDFNNMSDIGKTLRGRLNDHFSIHHLQKMTVEKASDGTRKYLFKLSDGQFIESVLIPERNHDTLCISSQVGCALGCRFCLTGKGGFVRNLTRGEILGQIIDIKRDMDDPRRLTNVVLMGMGEPLANYDAVVSAIETITDAAFGMAFANRRVTLSTAGLAPAITRLGQDTAISLAVSLNATDNRTRNHLMPINRKYPLETLLEACRRYPLKKHRKITFEYILIKGVNDTEQDAQRLSRLLRPSWAKINLIPFNPIDQCDYSCPDDLVIDRFMEILHRRHFISIVRHSKGPDISAACGQLRVRATSTEE